MQIGKWIIAVFNFGGLVADALVPSTARQHLWNARWPPTRQVSQWAGDAHGDLRRSVTLAVLFGSRTLTLRLLLLAAASAANYFVAMVLAPLFPGTAWTDPEFAAETGRPLGLASQQLVSYVVCGLVLLTVGLALFRR